MEGILEDEDKELIKALKDDSTSFDEIEVTFFNLDILPSKIIEFLSSYKEKKVKLFTLSRALFSYLTKLGLTPIYVPRKTISHSREYKKAKYLAIGGSADSSDKIFKIIENLPVSYLTIFIVQHVCETKENLLGDLLRSKTHYRVLMGENKMKVEESTIYIAPTAHHMTVEKGYIKLTKEPPYNYARPSIDVTFNSLANEYKNNLISLTLCGYGVDGIESLKTLNQNESMILIEDPKDCTADILPKEAISSGLYSKILTIEEILRFLHHTFAKEEDLEDEIDLFLEDVYKKYHYDFRNYQKSSLKRRIKNFMTNEDILTFGEFEKEVLENKEIFDKFFLDFTINVTSFFRDPKMFKTLKEKILTTLKTKSHIKIWSAGCSTGEEPYSLAIILYEMGILDKTYIYATDLNGNIIKQSINGLFPKKRLEENIENYIKAGGENSFLDYIHVEKEYFKIHDFLKKRTLFFTHSLTNSGILNEFDIILCRNVMIYFEKPLQQRVFTLFRNSMDKDGILILGESETSMAKEGLIHFRPMTGNTGFFTPRENNEF